MLYYIYLYCLGSLYCDSPPKVPEGVGHDSPFPLYSFCYKKMSPEV